MKRTYLGALLFVTFVVLLIPKTIFAESKNSSYSDFITVLVKSMNYPLTKNKDSLKIGKSSATIYFETAYQNKLISTSSLGKGFKPTQGITNLAAAKLIVTALKIKPVNSSSPFYDSKDGNAIALYKAQIIQGSIGKNGKRYFKPTALLTKTELSTISTKIREYCIAHAALKTVPITVKVNGGTLPIKGNKPYLLDNTLMLPVIDIAHGMGYKENYNSGLKVLTLTRSDKKIVLKVGDNYGVVTDLKTNVATKKTIGSKIILYGSSVFVEKAVVSSVFGEYASFKSNTLDIKTKNETVVVKLNNKVVSLNNRIYFDQNNFPLLPVAEIAAKLGYTTKVTDGALEIKRKDGKVVTIKEGSQTVTVDGVATTEAYVVQTMDGQLYVPNVFMYKYMNATSDWFKDSNLLLICPFVKKKTITYCDLNDDRNNKFEYKLTQISVKDRLLMSGEYKQTFDGRAASTNDSYKFIISWRKNEQINQGHVANSDYNIYVDENSYDYKSRQKIKEILQITFPESWQQAYTYFMKTIRQELWEHGYDTNWPGIYYKKLDDRCITIENLRDKSTNKGTSIRIDLPDIEYNKDIADMGVHNWAMWGKKDPYVNDLIKKYDLLRE